MTIAVRERVETEGFGPWSMKADVLHVQPTAEVLEHMITVRLHPDNCGEENGALRVIPGSHLHGRIPEQAILHVAAFVEQLGRTHSKPTVKQHLATIRMLFSWLVTGHIMDTNPAHGLRGPKQSVRKGKTSVLSAEELHELLAAIDTTSLLGLRDRAIIALMGCTFARVGAATGMRVQDYYVQERRGWVRLHEKGSKMTELPAVTTSISIWRSGSPRPDSPANPRRRSFLPCAMAG